MNELKEINIAVLTYDIEFQDSDEGFCWAGEGQKIIRVFQDINKANDLVKQWNPVFKDAELEHTVFPIQANNMKLKTEFGFTLHDMEGNSNFKLSIQ